MLFEAVVEQGKGVEETWQHSSIKKIKRTWQWGGGGGGGEKGEGGEVGGGGGEGLEQDN